MDNKRKVTAEDIAPYKELEARGSHTPEEEIIYDLIHDLEVADWEIQRLKDHIVAFKEVHATGIEAESERLRKGYRSLIRFINRRVGEPDSIGRRHLYFEGSRLENINSEAQAALKEL